MNKRFLTSTLIFSTLIIMLLVTVIVGNATNEQEDIFDSQSKSLIEAIQKEISNNKDTDHLNSLQSKLEMLQYQAVVQAAAKNSSPEKPTNKCMAMPKTSIIEEIRPTGILSGAPGPFSSQILRVENQWQEQINGYWFHLYAGVSGLDPNKGGVILWIEDVESGGFFEDPNPEGSLKITNSYGSRLELQTPSGNLRYFDILAQQFVTNLEMSVKEVELPLPYLFDPCAD